MPFARAHYTATGVVAAIAMFLAREPLMDLAGKIVDGAKSKTKKRRKAAHQIENGDSGMTDQDTTTTEDEVGDSPARHRSL